LARGSSASSPPRAYARRHAHNVAVEIPRALHHARIFSPLAAYARSACAFSAGV
jgi:hypothetical protein